IGDLLAGDPFGGSGDSGFAIAWSGVDGHKIFRLNGDPTPTQFGAAVGALGDVDRDGFDDFVVGEPAHVVGSDWLGAAYIYSGRTARVLCRIDGDFADGSAGQSFAILPFGADSRVDRDAIPDLVFGAPDDGAQTSRGWAQLRRLDDLFLQIDPPAAAAGDAVAHETRDGPPGQPVGLFAVA